MSQGFGTVVVMASMKYPRLHDPEWVAARLRDGATQTEIAAEVGCDPSTVSKLVERHGLRHLMGIPEPLPAADILEANDAGESAAAIARRFGVGAGRVRTVLLAHGRTRPAVRPAELDDRRWLVGRHHGRRMTLTAIAVELGCDTQTVSRAMRRLDVEVVQHSQAPNDQLVDARWLRRHYVDHGLSLADISRIVGRPRQAVSRALHRAGIPTRPAGSAGAVRHEHQMAA